MHVRSFGLLVTFAAVMCAARGFAVSGRDTPSGPELDASLRKLEALALADSRVRLAATPDMGVGVFATKFIRKGDVYLYVPRSSCIHRAAIMSSPAADLIQRTIKAFQTDTSVMLAVYLMHERLAGAGSKYAAYIDTLPTTLPTPTFFSPTELSLLDGSLLADFAKTDAARLERVHAHLVREVFTADEARRYTLSLYRWASAIVGSRQINVAGLPRDQMAHLLPVVDMINAKESDDRTFTSYDSARDAIVLHADDTYRVGEQIFETYDNKSNMEYLRYNGFVMANNPNDCVVLRLPDLLHLDSERRAAAQAVNLGETPCVGTSPRTKAALDKLMQLAEILAAPRAEIVLKEYSTATRRKALTWLSDHVIARARAYPTPSSAAVALQTEAARFARAFIAAEKETLTKLRLLFGQMAKANVGKSADASKRRASKHDEL